MKKLTLVSRDKRIFGAVAVLSMILVSGCAEETPDDVTGEVSEEVSENLGDALEAESAKDGKVDLEALKAVNPDIFGWIYISDGEVDAPILQNADDDQYYMTHNSRGEQDEAGAVFTEFPGRLDFCDFNEVDCLSITIQLQKSCYYPRECFLIKLLSK